MTKVEDISQDKMIFTVKTFNEKIVSLQKEIKQLEKDRLDSINAFAQKLNKIQEEIRQYEGKLSNIKELFELEYGKRINHIKDLEDQLHAKLQEADNNKHLTSVTLGDAQRKFSEADDKHVALKQKEELHAEIINNHISIRNNEYEQLRIRNAESAVIQEKANSILAEAQKKMENAIVKEKEIEEKANLLVHINANLSQDIINSKNLQLENEDKISEIKKRDIDLTNNQNKVNLDMAEIIRMRDEIDVATARLSKKQVDLDEQIKNLKAAEIRFQVSSQMLVDKEQHINGQMEKLSQLKNDVEILLKQKESKEAENVSRES